MAITIQAYSGNNYTYLRHNNEIVEGSQDEVLSPISFNRRERIRSLPNLQVFTLGLTTKCNLRCTYCCYSGNYRNTRSHGNISMKFKDVDKVLNFININASQRPVIISFYGGESLLEIDILKEFVRKAQLRWEEDVKFEISTNGTLLTDENIEYFVNHGFSLFISLDGSASIHDRQRIYSNGKGSFEAIRMSLKSFSDNYPDFYKNNVHLMMTVIDVSEMPYIAKEWHEDELLNSKTPIRISSVAPNYSLGVEKENVDDCLSKYMSILKYYEKHPQYELLRVFFERFLAEWINRPIINLDINENAPTCVPNNTKLYIDVEGKIGICEKIPDIYRIGSLSTGLDFQAINNIADKTATIIKSRCGKCPVARLCDICPNVIDLSDDEMNVYCHNQRVIQEVKFRIFCEMAERGLI